MPIAGGHRLSQASAAAALDRIYFSSVALRQANFAFGGIRPADAVLLRAQLGLHTQSQGALLERHARQQAILVEYAGY
jgi:hypothetical protein